MQRRRAIEVPRTPALTASPCSRPANGRAQDGVPHIAHVGATAQSERMPHLMDDHIAEAGRIQNPHERPDNDVSLDDGSNGRAHAWRQARLSLGPRPLGRAEHRPGHIEPNLIASGTQIPGAATGAVSGIARHGLCPCRIPSRDSGADGLLELDGPNTSRSASLRRAERDRPARRVPPSDRGAAGWG